MKLFIGIDPAINSTGVCIRLCEDDSTEKWCKYYIIKCNEHRLKKDGSEKDPLTKAEKEAAQKYQDIFKYVLYDKYIQDKDEEAEYNEKMKTLSFIDIVRKLSHIVCTEWQNAGCPDTWVVIEGISYGSTGHTTAVFDLAGLNYLMRQEMMEFTSNMIIATPGHVKKFATGNGSAKKDLMVETFKASHPKFDIPKIDDIADAWFMSRLAQKHFENNENFSLSSV